MDGGTLVLGLAMTSIGFIAIKLATPVKRENKEIELVKLRNIGVLSNDELKEVLEVYHNKNSIKEEYEKYKNLINELRDIGFFSYEEYLSKINKLNKYFKVD